MVRERAASEGEAVFVGARACWEAGGAGEGCEEIGGVCSAGIDAWAVCANGAGEGADAAAVACCLEANAKGWEGVEGVTGCCGAGVAFCPNAGDWPKTEACGAAL